MAGHRAARVAEEIKRELARLIRDEMKDPRLGFVSITDVEVSKDIRHAKVYVSVLGDEEVRKATLTALKQATGYLRSELSNNIRVRFMPELAFQFDDSIEKGSRINELLSQAKRNEQE
ncbi:30S ribosome-binding factor RbfA [Heliorestis acidaminivorans]|uniref:Ribosome-binding factor A n=1 Tax=Heliorestis acidaminivorans TaxID=553427 RepID=A0A6I0F2Y9_9FIRM|nr:30S ribosome-binding factor RbfA [Heliorestis acidaminivorans]KAB2954351.1 30S ribosome-binding factor RbfA [Heliorestis acidaminivorans]